MIKIRNATKADKEAIAEFQMAMALETENLALDKEVVILGVEAVFEDSSKGAYYIAESNGNVIGSLLTTYEWSDWRNCQVLWIQSVFVKKEFRGMGVFKMLYENIKSKVLDKKNGYCGLRLYVDKTNKSAQSVYKKLGMENHHYETFEWMLK
jgi:predicted GNAT family acetyltransferase